MKNLMKTVIIVLVLQLAFVFVAFADNGMNNMVNAKGKVLEVIDEQSAQNMGYDENSLIQGVQKVKILITTGEYKGREVIVENYLQGSPVSDVRAKEGQRLLMAIDKSDSENIQFLFLPMKEMYIYMD